MCQLWSLTAATLCVVLVALGYRLESPLVVLCLAAATAVAERWSVPISATTDLTVYLLPTVFAAVVFGPLAAGVIAAASMLGDPELFRRGDPARAPRLKWANYTAASFITGAVAGSYGAGAHGRLDRCDRRGDLRRDGGC